MPLAAAIPLVIVLLMLGMAGSSYSAPTDNEGSVIMSRQGIFSGIDTTAPPADAVTDISVSLPGFGVSTSVGSAPAVTESTIVSAPVTSVIDTQRPQDITSVSATLRGQVKAATDSRVFFIHSSNQAALRRVTQATSYDDVVKNRPSDVTVQTVSVYTPTEQVVRQYAYSLRPDVTYYYQLCVDDTRAGIACADVVNFITSDSPYRSSYFSAPTVNVFSATDITAYEATVTGSYYVNSGEDLTVFLVYGTSQSEINTVATNFDTYEAVRTANADFDAVRLKARANQDGNVTYTMDDLDRDTTYYYALCAAYTGENDGIACGYGYSFTTKDRDRDEPTLRLSVAPGARAATFTSHVNMNDYLDGRAFIAYGTNQSYVQAVADSYSFANIFQRGDELQLVSLDDDADGEQTFTRTIKDMTAPSSYFARTCVEYEQEDQYGYDRVVVDCGPTIPFTLQ